MPENKTPWVSFCMSTYKRPQFLKSALENIQLQTFQDFEVIVSDNDPEQSARTVVEALGDSRFHYFHNECNLGMVKSFNRSLERSSGAFVVMITDDDPVYPHMLEMLFNVSEKYPGYGMYFGGHDVYYTNIESAENAKAKPGVNHIFADFLPGEVKPFTSTEFPNAFFNTNFGGGILWSVAIVKRSTAMKMGGMPDYGSPCLADCGYILLGGADAGAVFLNISLGRITIHNENFSYTNTNFEILYKAPSGFVNWVTERITEKNQNDLFLGQLKNYTGRSLIVYFINIKKGLKKDKLKLREFELFMKKIFQIDFMKPWKLKFFVATEFPYLFKVFVSLKQNILSSLNKI